ncbi:MAG: SIS domain-containing protein [Acidobacteriaceae bacterium]
MQMQEIVADQLRQTATVLSEVYLAKDTELHKGLVDASSETAKSLKNGHKLMVAGNGGSAAAAQHLVAEFVSRLVKDRAALRAIALTTDYFDCGRK